MAGIDWGEYRELVATTKELLERKFAGEVLELRFAAWDSLCKAMLYRNSISKKFSDPRTVAIHAYKTILGMETISERTLTKLRIKEIEALRKMEGTKAPKLVGRIMSNLQRSLSKPKIRRS